MRVTIIGSGYVGLVTAACLAETGNDVVCADISAAKIARLKANDIPIYEPGLEALVRQNQADRRLEFTTEVGPAIERAWVVIEPGRDGHIRYRVNREHPAVRQVLERGDDIATAVEGMLQIVEATVPVQRIWLDTVDRGDVDVPRADADESTAVEPILRLVFNHMVHGDGLSPAEARRKLLRTEPFQKFPQLVENVVAAIQPAGAL